MSITEVSITHPEHIGSDCYLLHYKCDECGKIEKEIYVGFNADYHELADCATGDHLKMHSYCELGEKFETIIKIIKGIGK